MTEELRGPTLKGWVCPGWVGVTTTGLDFEMFMPCDCFIAEAGRPLIKFILTRVQPSRHPMLLGTRLQIHNQIIQQPVSCHFPCSKSRLHHTRTPSPIPFSISPHILSASLTQMARRAPVPVPSSLWCPSPSVPLRPPLRTSSPPSVRRSPSPDSVRRRSGARP